MLGPDKPFAEVANMQRRTAHNTPHHVAHSFVKAFLKQGLASKVVYTQRLAHLIEKRGAARCYRQFLHERTRYNIDNGNINKTRIQISGWIRKVS
jgi:hypothetical protein